jgi:hypothetical protein
MPSEMVVLLLILKISELQTFLRFSIIRLRAVFRMCALLTLTGYAREYELEHCYKRSSLASIWLPSNPQVPVGETSLNPLLALARKRVLPTASLLLGLWH